MSYPAPFCIYKKSAAAQFVLLPPKRNEKGRIEKEGAVLVEVAKAVSEKTYDWTNKITFALGINDMLQIFDNLDNPPRLLHKLGEVTKTLELKQGEAQYAGTYMMHISDASTKNKISVPLSGGEYFVLTGLFKSSIAKMLGWE